MILTILYFILAYVTVMLFAMGWRLSFIPKMPEKTTARGCEGYKVHSINECWYHYNNPEWIEWDKVYGDKYADILWSTSLWPFVLVYMIIMLPFHIGNSIGTSYNKRIDLKKKELENLDKEIELAKAELLKESVEVDTCLSGA